MKARLTKIDFIGNSNRTHATGKHDEINSIDLFLNIVGEIEDATVAHFRHARAHVTFHSEAIERIHELCRLDCIGIACDGIPHLEHVDLFGAMNGKVLGNLGTR